MRDFPHDCGTVDTYEKSCKIPVPKKPVISCMNDLRPICDGGVYPLIRVTQEFPADTAW